jgi:hypothetical protein
LILVKHEQEEHLIARAEELIAFALNKGSPKLSIAQRKLPIKQSSIVVLRVIELGESVHRHADLMRNRLLELVILLVIRPVALRENFDREVDF